MSRNSLIESVASMNTLVFRTLLCSLACAGLRLSAQGLEPQKPLPANELSLPPGFKAERLYAVPRGAASLISMTFERVTLLVTIVTSFTLVQAVEADLEQIMSEETGEQVNLVCRFAGLAACTQKDCLHTKSHFKDMTFYRLHNQAINCFILRSAFAKYSRPPVT